MKLKDRVIRTTTALTLAGVIASLIPMRSNTVFGSIQQPSDGYLNPGGDNSGSFLGIRGLSNRDAITGLGVLLVGLGAYSTLSDSRSSGAAPGSGAGNTNLPQSALSNSTESIFSLLGSPNNDFSELMRLVEVTPLKEKLENKGSYTFFAPTNMALMAADLTRYTQNADKSALTQLLSQHIVKGSFTISDLMALKNGTKLTTLAGTTVTIRNQNGFLTVNNVTVIQNDIAASNGWIHPIEAVLEPS